MGNGVTSGYRNLGRKILQIEGYYMRTLLERIDELYTSTVKSEHWKINLIRHEVEKLIRSLDYYESTYNFLIKKSSPQGK